MTIRETLIAWKAARIAKLIELNAPKEILDAEKEGQAVGPQVRGLDKFGDLEVVRTVDLCEAVEHGSSAYVFHVQDGRTFILATVLEDSKAVRTLIELLVSY